MQNEVGGCETDDSADSEKSDSSYVRIVDAAYKKKVMDDLDALLADLQNTTAHISSYQHNQRQQQQDHHQPPPPPSSSTNNNSHLVNHQSRGYNPQQDQSHFTTGNNSPRYNQYQPPSQHYPHPSSLPHHQQQHQQHQQQQHQQYQQQHQQYNHYPPPPPHLQQQQQHHQHQQFPGPPVPPSNPNQYSPPTSTPANHVYYTVEAVNYETRGQASDGYGYAYNSGEEEANASSASTPPPLPPPPPSEVLDSLAHHQQQQQQQRQDIILRQHSNTPPPPSFQQHSAPSGGGGVTTDFDNVQTRSEVKGRGERMSALSNNLSELDQLLQDLNSAQFMAEVDRKSTVNDIPVVVNGNINNNISNDSGGIKAHPPSVAPKPKRNTVDCLLDELECTPDSTPRFPVDPPYQELGPGNHAIQYHSSSSSSSSSHPLQSASSATKELDDLMMSLSEFKIQDKEQPGDPHTNDRGEPTYARPVKSRTTSASSPLSPAPPPHGAPNATQLESMLGDLQSDMTKQGVNTKQKGVCAACNKPIVGQVIAALGQTWHIEHFTCAHCDEPLGTRNFYERDGMAYCETDYHHLFAPRCAYCNGPIVDKCITALEKMWHPEHFFCAQCGHPFGEEDFHEKNGKAYCRNDYFAMFAPKCGGCGQPIMENYISALNRQWHPECFVCWDCQAPFGAGSFFDYEGLPYCETHYHAKKGSLCASCEKPITGRCITAMFKKFHPEHFVCAFCLKQLNKGTFKEQNDKPYCHPCFVKLFG